MSVGLPSGRRLGGYRLVQQIGAGGMGVVHLALDENDRAVALKVLRDHVAADPGARRRLGREVETLQRVRSPRVAEVLDADVECETPYLVTRYVPAASLEEVVEQRGPLPPAALVQLGLGLGDALAAIHAAGVVHRDLKPANVLMLDGDPVVIDFGIAHVADGARLTSTGLVMGTPGYLSPELAEGHPVTKATDWWGWAATMTYASTGRPPFGTGPIEAVLDRVRRGVADLGGVPDDLAEHLAAALAPDPAERPAPGALRRALEAMQERLGRREAERTAPTVAIESGAAAAATPRPTEPEPAAAATSEQTQVVRPPSPREPHEGDTKREGGPPRGAAGNAAESVQPDSSAATQQLEPVPTAPSGVGVPGTAALPTVAATQHLPSTKPTVEKGRNDAAPRPAPSPPADPPGAEVDPSAATAPKPTRTGSLLAVLAMFAALAALAPVAALGLGVLGYVLARTVDAVTGSLLRRRYERGVRRGDLGVALAASPWHFLVQTLWSVLYLLLPLVLAASTLSALTAAFVAPSTEQRQASYAAAAVVAALGAWWGPGGTALRRGARAMVRAVSPPSRDPRVFAGVMLGVAVVVVGLVLASAGDPIWAPLQGPPSLLGGP